MPKLRHLNREIFRSDATAGVVVFLVALPLCLGVALASGAPLFAGLVAGIVGGIVVGALSGSHTSVSGPAAGLAAIVAAQIASLGSFESFLAAVVVCGLIQIAMGIGKLGFIADFFPTAVIKGLLAAIGVILILKQIPHALGHDPDPEGEMAFFQIDDRNTFSEILAIASDIHWGAAAIGAASLLLLVAWERFKPKRLSGIPGPVIVVALGAAMVELFDRAGGAWAVEASHRVQVPTPKTYVEVLGFFLLPNPSELLDLLRLPNPAAWLDAATWRAGVTLAIVASLETLLNLEAVDKIDPLSRTSPPNRELWAQGIGNVVAGLIGGIPITSVIVRSSVNINAGARTRVSAILHGLLILTCVSLFPTWLNRIPLACLASILLVTGYKLASPDLFVAMWKMGPNQFLPFVFTVVAIVFTDLLVGVLIGLAIAIAFILWSNVRRPLRRIVEKHAAGNVLHFRLANQVSFLNRAAIVNALNDVLPGSHILIDAQDTDYIDPDVLDLLREFERKTAPSRGIRVSLQGFHERYQFVDRIQFVDYSTRELQRSITPAQALAILKDGHARFLAGQRLERDLNRQLDGTSTGQFPFAVVLSCIDSRAPAELIFDCGVGDIFSIRIAGNVAKQKVLGSMEYACAVAGAKLVLVMGHTRCGAVTAAVDLAISHTSAAESTGCTNLDALITEIQKSYRPGANPVSAEERAALIEEVTDRNIRQTLDSIREQSPALAALEREGRIAIIGSKYDVATGRIAFIDDLAV